MLRLLTLSALLVAAPVWAQQPGLTGDEPAPALRLAPTTTAYTIGYLNVDFRYASAENGHVYAFDDSALSFMISSRTSSLMFAYGRSEVLLPDSVPVTGGSLISVDLITGGNIDVVTIPGPVPVGAYIPIRLHLGYKTVSAAMPSQEAERPSAIHLPSAGIGAGGGAWMRIPTDIPLLADRLVAFGSLTVAYGGMAEIVDEFRFEETRVTRTTDFNLEARLERFLADRTGLTIGYTYRTTSWSDAYLAELRTSHEALTSDLSGFSQRNRQHLLRIGFNW